MIEHFMGTENFYSALRTYLNKQRLTGITTYSALLSAFTEQMSNTASPENMSERFEKWITQPGFPLVSVSRTNNSLKLQQNRFLLDRSNGSVEYTWDIPIAVVTPSSKPNKTIWMESRQCTNLIFYS